MKKYLIILIVLMTSKTFAQRERVLNLPHFDKYRFHYGFYLGGNQNNFAITYKKNSFFEPDDRNPLISVKSNFGFNLGLIGDMKINKNINLRFEPGLISNTKILTYHYERQNVKTNDIKRGEQDKERKIGNTYLHLPLIFKFSADRYGNIRPYVLGGVSYDYNFSSNEKRKDNFSGEFRQKSNIFMYEIGIGMDFYLEYFKFSPSIRGIFAINNELKYDDKNNGASQWTDPIDFLGTRGVFIHFAFE